MDPAENDPVKFSQGVSVSCPYHPADFRVGTRTYPGISRVCETFLPHLFAAADHSGFLRHEEWLLSAEHAG